jgi:4-amino-4-deoxy-L-arabinose transferase-like glycosyltransferase
VPRTVRLALALLAALLLASLPFLVHPWYVPSGDASLYVATAKALAAGEGYRYLGEPFVVRPPGFSALLAPVIAARGVDFQALNLLVASSGVAAALCLFALARERLGAGLAALVAAALWLNPGFRALSNELLSDVPGLAALLGCLLLERFASRRPGAAREVLLGVAIGAAAYLRAALLLLAPAVALARLARRPRPAGDLGGWLRHLALGCALPVACAGLVVLPWWLRSAALEPRAAVDQTRLHSYGVAMWREDPADPESPRRSLAELAERAPLRALQIADALGSRLQSDTRGDRLPRAATLPGRALVAAILLAASLRLFMRRREAAELTVWITLATLLVYFGFGQRLVLPVYALALPAAAEAARDWVARRAGARAATLATGALLVALALFDLDPRRGWAEAERTHRDFVALAGAIAERVPAEATLASALGFNYAVYLDRPVLSLYPAIAGAPDPRAAAAAVIERRGVDRVVLWPAVPRERELIPYFEERLGPGEPVGPALLWDLRAPRRAGN